MTVEIKKGGAVQKSSDLVLAGLKKAHGDSFGSVGGDYTEAPRIATGVFPFDLACGGGIPRRKVTEIFGPESSGKTALLYRMLARVQVMGLTGVLIDLENSHDNAWASRFGVDCKKLLVIRPDNAEQTVDAIEAMMYADDVGLIGLDSVAAMVTSNEITKGAEVAAVGGASALVGKMMRKCGSAFTSQVKKGFFPTIAYCNQTRFKVGVMYGDPETTPGGNALKFWASLRIRLYGKNVMVEKINKDMPTFKHTSGIIKKWKVPIVGSTFEYDMCLVAHDGMSVGSVNAWNTVGNYLKSLTTIKKITSGGYLLFDEQYKTLEAIQDHYFTDPIFRIKCEKSIIETVKKIEAQK